MGFLDVGSALDWPEAQPYLEYVKEHGVIQFLKLLEINKQRVDTDFKWGEELVEFNEDGTSARLAVGASKIVQYLEEAEEHVTGIKNQWHPEFADSMVEALPFPPYDQTLASVLDIEDSMRTRRAKIAEALAAVFPGRDIRNLSLAAFPTMGAGDWLAADYKPDPVNSASRSVFLPSEFINPHPRFPTLMSNIRQRRGAKVVILMPLFQDENTGKDEAWALSKPLSNVDRYEVEELSMKTPNPVKNFIYMDGMGFGMGNSCLQVTFLAIDLHEARRLTDAFAALAPLFLPLTAATPFLRGLVAATDSRWDVIAQSVDCRTVEEEFNPDSTFKKSRYGNISLYISGEESEESRALTHKLNDTVAPNATEYEAQAIRGGVDEILARHIGFMFSRDPLVIYGAKISSIDDNTNSNHFENIQSTNWNSVRFKPPPPSADGKTPAEIGWRVEFRTPDLQVTDFENSAVAAVILLFVQFFREQGTKLDIRSLISSNDNNAHEGQKMNVAQTQQRVFKVKKNWFDVSSTSHEEVSVSLGEFFCGGNGFHGFIPILQTYLDSKKHTLSEEVYARYADYFEFITKRATGELLTDAAFFRAFLMSHPLYKKDSVVPPQAAAELLDLVSKIQDGKVRAPQLMGRFPATHNGKTCFPEVSDASIPDYFVSVPLNSSTKRHSCCHSKGHFVIQPGAVSTECTGEFIEKKEQDCPWCGGDHVDTSVPPAQQ